MPVYYFDLLDDDELTRDFEGQQFPDIDAAIAEAKQAFTEARDDLWPVLTIQIRLGGTIVATVKNSEVP